MSWTGLVFNKKNLKINRDHQLIEGNPCTNFDLDEGYLADNTVAEKSGLSLTFEHVTWKSIRIIYSLRATPAPSLVLIKWRGQKILSGQHLVYRTTYRPTGPLCQGGHKNEFSFSNIYFIIIYLLYVLRLYNYEFINCNISGRIQKVWAPTVIT